MIAGCEATLFQAPHGEVASATPTTATSATNATPPARAGGARGSASRPPGRSTGTGRATAATRMLVAQRGRPSKRATSTRSRKFAHRTSPMPMTIASLATKLERDASPAVGSSRAISGATRTASATVDAPGAPEKTRAATRPRTTGDVHVAAVAQPLGPGAVSAEARRQNTTSRMAAGGARTPAYPQNRLTPESLTAPGFPGAAIGTMVPGRMPGKAATSTRRRAAIDIARL